MRRDLPGESMNGQMHSQMPSITAMSKPDFAGASSYCHEGELSATLDRLRKQGCHG
jgi:hypothetical protein